MRAFAMQGALGCLLRQQICKPSRKNGHPGGLISDIEVVARSVQQRYGEMDSVLVILYLRSILIVLMSIMLRGLLR